MNMVEADRLIGLTILFFILGQLPVAVQHGVEKDIDSTHPALAMGTYCGLLGYLFIWGTPYLWTGIIALLCYFYLLIPLIGLSEIFFYGRIEPTGRPLVDSFLPSLGGLLVSIACAVGMCLETLFAHWWVILLLIFFTMGSKAFLRFEK